MQVPFLDLKVQYRQIEAELKPILEDIMANGAFIGGPQVAAFEEEFAAFCGGGHCVGLNSGTDALRFALIAAGVGPGIMLAIIMALYIYVYAHVKRIDTGNPFRWAPFVAALRQGVWAIMMPVIVFGGIYGGLFTPTEGAAIGAASTFITAVAKKEMSFDAFKRSFLGAAEICGFIFMIFLGADMLNGALALSQMPARVAETVGSLALPPVAVIVAILLFYVVLSSVMDELSMIILTVPILFPLVMELNLYGLNETEKAVWFGILVLSVVEIGLIAPPVGLNVYVVNSLAPDVPMSETYKGVFLFLAADVVRIALLVYFPFLSLWLMRLLS